MDYRKLYDSLMTIRDTCNEMQKGDGKCHKYMNEVEND